MEPHRTSRWSRDKSYLGVAVVGVGVLGVAVLGTAVLGVTVLGVAVLGVAVLGTGVLHPGSRVSPSLGSRLRPSLTKVHHTACSRKSNSRWPKIGYLGVAVLGVAVLGTAVLGVDVLGIAVLRRTLTHSARPWFAPHLSIRASQSSSRNSMSRWPSLMGYLGVAVLGVAVLGTAVLGVDVLGIAVLHRTLTHSARPWFAPHLSIRASQSSSRNSMSRWPSLMGYLGVAVLGVGVLGIAVLQPRPRIHGARWCKGGTRRCKGGTRWCKVVQGWCMGGVLHDTAIQRSATWARPL
jgi:hypothetical protein